MKKLILNNIAAICVSTLIISFTIGICYIMDATTTILWTAGHLGAIIYIATQEKFWK